MDGPLLTDLYQLTMLQACFDRGMRERASFEFFVRKLPAPRNFLVAAGPEQVLRFLALGFAASRELVRRHFASLPTTLSGLVPVEAHPVEVSAALRAQAEAADARRSAEPLHG